MQVVFRVDASLKIGSGHVMRSLTLADELKNRNCSVLFICRILDGNLISHIKEKGFPVVSLSQAPGVEPLSKDDSCYDLWLEVPWRQDLHETLAVFDTLPKQTDWLIVDHYGLDFRWEEGMALRGVKLMAIDDLANRKHCCQVLLDQSFTINQDKRYQKLTPEKCHLLLGPQYALLREEFSKARLARKKKHENIGTILVFFGGVDASNETLKVLKAILLLKNDSLIVDVLVGAQNPHHDAIKNFCKMSSLFHFHFQPDSVADLMVNADLAIGAGGTFTWERCTVGLPTFAWPVAENQKELLFNASRVGAVYVPDVSSVSSVEGIHSHLFALMNNPNLCFHISGQAKNICDGQGVVRVVNALVDLNIVVRKAVMTDCENIYHWRVHPDIQRFSSNSGDFSIDAHRIWFTALLNNKNRFLLVGEVLGRPVGVIRYDVDKKTAEVSIYLAPNMTSKGYGVELLSAGEYWLRENVLHVESIKAVILNNNIRSMKMFERAGYILRSRVYKKQLRS